MRENTNNTCYSINFKTSLWWCTFFKLLLPKLSPTSKIEISYNVILYQSTFPEFYCIFGAWRKSFEASMQEFQLVTRPAFIFLYPAWKKIWSIQVLCIRGATNIFRRYTSIALFPWCPCTQRTKAQWELNFIGFVRGRQVRLNYEAPPRSFGNILYLFWFLHFTVHIRMRCASRIYTSHCWV